MHEAPVRPYYAAQGRGAIVIDTSQVIESGNPFYYVPAKDVTTLNQAEAVRMVQHYDPSWEFVAMLLKAEITSTYRVGVPAARWGKTQHQ